MKENVKIILEEYDKRIIAESDLMKSLPLNEGMNRRNEFLLSVGEDTAIFLNTLIKSAKPNLILEIGTSYGYSTIWLAEAAQSYGGKVITLECDNEKAKFAKQKISDAGLLNNVEFVIDDALEFLKKTNQKFDFVLLDIWKELYMPCFDLFFPKLNDKAYLVSDNMLFPAHSKSEMDNYRNHIKSLNVFDTILLPIGSGIEISQVIHSNNSISNEAIKNEAIKK